MLPSSLSTASNGLPSRRGDAKDSQRASRGATPVATDQHLIFSFTDYDTAIAASSRRKNKQKMKLAARGVVIHDVTLGVTSVFQRLGGNPFSRRPLFTRLVGVLYLHSCQLLPMPLATSSGTRNETAFRIMSRIAGRIVSSSASGTSNTSSSCTCSSMRAPLPLDSSSR